MKLYTGSSDYYNDGIAILAPDVEPVQRCLTCHEPREDFSMPCEWCGDID